MKVKENSVFNSPYNHHARYVDFYDEGITDWLVEEGRTSSYFVPIPKPRKRGAQLAFDAEWMQDTGEENIFVMTGLLRGNTDATERNDVSNGPISLKSLSNGFQTYVAYICRLWGHEDRNKE